MSDNVFIFFEILEKFRNYGAVIKGEISIPIFKGENDNYNMYFLFNMKSINIENLMYEYDEYFCEEISHNPNNICISLPNVTKEELNYILFAFNMKYSVVTNTLENFDEKEIISFCTNHNLSINYKIYVHKNTLKDDLLQHFEGTKYNFFKYNNSLSSKTKVIYNSKQSYEKYIEMLNHYILDELQIKEAYLCSYDEFEENKKNNKKENRLIFLPNKQ